MSEGLSFDLALGHPGFTLSASADLPGQGITALVGPSGSGKTTLLQAIAGLEAAAGHVTLNGRALHPLPPHKRGVAVVFQNARLFGHMDVAGNIGFGARRRGTDPAAVARIVAALDLGPLMGRSVSRLSGGETRRVALARALAASPDLLLLDEPLSGLDAARRDEILPYLSRAIRAAGCPALFVTHDLEESLRLADRHLAMDGGRITGAARRPLALRLDDIPDDHMARRLGAQVLRPSQAMRAAERWSLVIDPASAIVMRAERLHAPDALILPARLGNAQGAGRAVEICGQDVVWPSSLSDFASVAGGLECQIAIRRPLFRLDGTGDDS
ncbi:ATP-binding cassette domain-containing protein [Maribius pontilimi]|uniref:ATP-binding cassette domain-containing protein n=1 Tax=Palleronia pontilimi TaxID=1964209 RepID=A0A934IGZ9_9RHOB|nr:ATP-binding cassette domain-containing protein [Palleronia pontilimi]